MSSDSVAQCAALLRERSPGPRHRLLGAAQGLADQATLAQCLAVAEQVCEAVPLADDDAMAVRLCVDEACANVLMHAYAHAPGSTRGAGPLALVCWASPESVVVGVADAGAPFDPNDAPPPVLEGDVEDRPIGGLGWFLVAQLMDASHYCRAPGGFNVNILTRRLGLVRDEAPSA